MSVREVIEATLRTRPDALVERCDALGILSTIELYGICDINSLRDLLSDADQLRDLRTAIGPAEPPAFLAFVKSELLRSEPALPETPVSGMGHAGFRTPGAFQTPAQAPAAETVPVVVTVKFNGKVLVAW